MTETMQHNHAPMNIDSAAIATLNIRVSGLENQLQQWTSNIGAQLTSLGTKIEERGRTQWPILVALAGVLLGFMTYLDSAKLGPLEKRDSEIIGIIKEMQSDMKVNVVPQWVHQREWKYRDDQFLAHSERVKLVETAMADRIKRMEEMYGTTWNMRDALQIFQQRIDRLEQALPKNQ